VISILPQGEKTEDKQKSEEVRSEVFVSCGVATVTFSVIIVRSYAVLPVTKSVLQLIVVTPDEYPINRII
jgi:hypothetical protein